MKNMSRRSFLGNTSKVAVGTALATSALGAVSVGTASSASASVTSASARRVVSSASSRRGAPYVYGCLLYTSPSPRDRTRSRMPSSA